MTAARIVEVREVAANVEYGLLYLHTGPTDPNAVPDAAARALASDGIAQGGTVLVVRSPETYNNRLTLRAEVWDREPSDDLDEWQEAFESGLVVTDYGLVYESPTCNSVRLAIRAGVYRAIITGRGFAEFGQSDKESREVIWRVRFSPATGLLVPRRLRGLSAREAARSQDAAEFLGATILSVGRDARRKTARLLLRLSTGIEFHLGAIGVTVMQASPLGSTEVVASAVWTRSAEDQTIELRLVTAVGAQLLIAADQFGPIDDTYS